MWVKVCVWSQFHLCSGDSAELEADLAPLLNLYRHPAVVLSMRSSLIINAHICVVSLKDHTLWHMPVVCGISLKAWLIRIVVQSRWFPRHPRRKQSKARRSVTCINKLQLIQKRHERNLACPHVTLGRSAFFLFFPLNFPVRIACDVILKSSPNSKNNKIGFPYCSKCL